MQSPQTPNSIKKLAACCPPLGGNNKKVCLSESGTPIIGMVARKQLEFKEDFECLMARETQTEAGFNTLKKNFWNKEIQEEAEFNQERREYEQNIGLFREASFSPRAATDMKVLGPVKF